MNYGELRTNFLDLLNRDDCSQTLADQFISMGLRRIERLLRTPMQRTTLSVTVDGSWPGYLVVPADYLSIYALKVNERTLRRETVTGAIEDHTGDPEAYFFNDGKLVFRPGLVADSVIDLHYYREFPQGVADSTITTYSAVINDVVVYAALAFAGSHFLDTRKGEFENMYQMLSQEVQLMADLDEWAGSSLQMTNPYEGVA